MTFGERLKAALAAADMSQSELARRMGLTSQRVNRWVKDRDPPSYKRIEDVADILGTTVAALLGDPGAAPVDATLPVTPAARFEAVREIVWRRHGGIKQAARDMRLPLSRLEAIRAGDAAPTKDETVILCGWADCPRGFIEGGRLEGMRPDLAWHLGHSAPHLVPHLLADGETVGGETGPADDG